MYSPYSFFQYLSILFSSSIRIPAIDFNTNRNHKFTQEYTKLISSSQAVVDKKWFINTEHPNNTDDEGKKHYSSGQYKERI
jgi:hypothetical protein